MAYRMEEKGERIGSREGKTGGREEGKGDKSKPLYF